MSAFSYHQMPAFLLDSLPLSNSTSLGVKNMEEEVHNFYAFSQPHTGGNKKQTASPSSTVVDNHETTVKLPDGKKRKNDNGASISSAASKGTKERKTKKQKKPLEEARKERKPSKKNQKKSVEEPSTGYIHVRARRGQATDSHSLAERVRREKISERMKILQCLVPGCDKVSGKALVLDKIINYVQSLQNQVEFLSMKLGSVNPLFYEYAMDLDDTMVKQEISVEQRFGALNPSVSMAGTSTGNICSPMGSSSLNVLQGEISAASLVCDSDWERQKLLSHVWFEHNGEFFQLQ